MVDDADPWIAHRQAIGDQPGAVEGTVVDEDDLEAIRHAGKGREGPSDGLLDVSFLIVER